VSSSIEEYFQPPEWATKEEVIKAAQHYINYWKIEARSRNQQWLDALQGADNAKRCEESLRGELNRKHKEFAILQSARERDVAEIHRLKAEVERLRKHGDAMAEALEAAGFNNARDFWNAAKEGKQP
jgi:methylphosphotriester-DNA--protein-cysteine methyltransferase